MQNDSKNKYSSFRKTPLTLKKANKKWRANHDHVVSIFVLPFVFALNVIPGRTLSLGAIRLSLRGRR